VFTPEPGAEERKNYGRIRNEAFICSLIRTGQHVSLPFFTLRLFYAIKGWSIISGIVISTRAYGVKLSSQSPDLILKYSIEMHLITIMMKHSVVVNTVNPVFAALNQFRPVPLSKYHGSGLQLPVRPH
jgi:hypothetical protein